MNHHLKRAAAEARNAARSCATMATILTITCFWCCFKHPGYTPVAIGVTAAFAWFVAATSFRDARNFENQSRQ